MKLIDLDKSIKAKVLKIDAPKELKLRLSSFGLIKESIVSIDEVSLGKSTIKVSVNDNTIAIRANEAQNIEVYPI